MDTILTPCQRKVAKLASFGLSRAQISRELRVATGTVNAHLEAVYLKLDCRSSTEMVRILREHPELLDQGSSPKSIINQRIKVLREQRIKAGLALIKLKYCLKEGSLTPKGAISEIERILRGIFAGRSSVRKMP